MSRRPNILYIFPDQYNHRCFGCMDEFPVRTPNLDAFREDSLTVDNAMSNYPVCSPYRGMLMAGKYPEKTGVTGNCNSSRNAYGVFLKTEERCITDIFHEQGYHVGYIGKWHLDPPEMSTQVYTDELRNGILWDSFTTKDRRHQVDYWLSYGAMDHHLEPHYWGNDTPMENSIKPGRWSVEYETDKAIEYLENRNGERDEDKPFMLMLAWNPPHPPYDEVPEKYRRRFSDIPAEELLKMPNYSKVNPRELEDQADRKGGDAAIVAIKDYLAAIEGIDDNFGRIIHVLKDQGLYDDTIIVFTSDHGDMMGSHNRMGKPSWYSEAFKVPFMIRYPERIKPGHSSCLLNVPDIMPTLLDLCNLQDAIPDDLDGWSKLSSLTGTEDEDESSLYFEYFTNTRGLKTRQYTFAAQKNWCGEIVRMYLYDDVNDPYQLNEISGERPEVCKRLLEKLNSELRRIKETRWF